MQVIRDLLTASHPPVRSAGFRNLPFRRFAIGGPPRPPRRTPRQLHTIHVADGTVLVMGGVNYAAYPGGMASTEFFDPGTMQFRAGPDQL